MKVFKRFPSQHTDFVHDVSFDFYGKRLATCSSDRKIKVWDIGDDGQWKLNAEWVAHQGSVWKLSWAHPEFGQVIASCSFDRTVFIWEEQDPKAKDPWRQQAQLVDSKQSVRDIKFSPKHLGLRLATAAADGYVRIYEAVDIMNISHWALHDEFLVDKEGVTCLSWNSSRFDPPMILVGGAHQYANVMVYNDVSNEWHNLCELRGHHDAVHDVSWAPSMGRSYHLLATASKDHSVRIWKLVDNDGKWGAQQIACLDHHQSEVWRVEWNVTGTMLSSSGDDGTVRMWKSNFEGEWVCVNEICGDMGSTESARAS